MPDAPTADSAPIEPPAPPIHFDERIDRIGFANELQKQYIDGVKSELKISLLEANVVVAEGQFFEALLTQSSSAATDVAKLFKLADKKKIPLKKLQACLKVDRTAAKKLFGDEALDGITTWSDGSQSLTVKRKAGVEVALVDALSQLSTAASAASAAKTGAA